MPKMEAGEVPELRIGAHHLDMATYFRIFRGVLKEHQSGNSEHPLVSSNCAIETSINRGFNGKMFYNGIFSALA